jgi:hypothetical protein
VSTPIILLVAVLGGLAGALLVPALARRWHRAHPRARSVPEGHHDHLSARVMFVVSRSPHLLVDCTVDTPGDGDLDLPTGQPITIGVRPPDSAWMAACATEMLQSWAADNEVVDVEIARGRSGPRAEIVKGDSRLVFELEGIAAGRR